MMKCHICGFRKMYIPQHEWRFREHVIMCNTKVDEESVVEVEQVEKDQVVINCMLCEKTFRNPSTLKLHLAMVHYRREIRAVFVTPTGEDQNLIKKCKECTYKTKALSGVCASRETEEKKVQVHQPDAIGLLPIKEGVKNMEESEEEIFKEETDYDEEMKD